MDKERFVAGKETSPAFEHRTRVTCHFPCNNAEEAHLIQAFVDYLEKRRGKPFGLHGYTHSAIRSPVYTGCWRLQKSKKYLKENVVLFLVDFDFPLESDQLTQAMREMRAKIQEWYETHTGLTQQEIWIVAHPVVRLVGDS